MKKIAIIVGSLRNESLNLKLANLLKDKLINFEVEVIRLNNIPLFNEDIEFPAPNEVSKLRYKVNESNALIFVTPEYNHSYSGVLKNTIDWLSRSISDDEESVLNNKLIALAGVSYGMSGSNSAQDDLVQLLSWNNAKLMNKPRLAINGSNLPIEKNIKYIEEFINSIELFIK